MSPADFIKSLGFERCVVFDPALLVPEDEIRALCERNACGHYNANYMCPPKIGSVDRFRRKFKQYRSALLLQSSESTVLDESLGSRGKYQKVFRSRNKFHLNLLKVEEYLKERGVTDVWTLGAGACGLCVECGMKEGKKCRHPQKARMSVEATGVNVMDLLKKLGLDNCFHRDRVTWTACILSRDESLARLFA